MNAFEELFFVAIDQLVNWRLHYYALKPLLRHEAKVRAVLRVNLGLALDAAFLANAWVSVAHRLRKEVESAVTADKRRVGIANATKHDQTTRRSRRRGGW